VDPDRREITLPIMVFPGHLPGEARCGAEICEEGGRKVDPVTTAGVVSAAIGAAGMVLAAWVQGRAQRPARDQEAPRSKDANPGRPAGEIVAAGAREVPPDAPR
jgi:hypothetical protein